MDFDYNAENLYIYNTKIIWMHETCYGDMHTSTFL